MPLLIICAVAFSASCLTFFSGFGLGTILMPAFVLFFPLDVAITLTAVVHFLNNILKLILLGKKARRDIVLKFGVPAFICAFLGARFLFQLEAMPAVFRYRIWGRVMAVMPVKLTIAVLMLLFVVLELMPWFKRLSFSVRYLPLGGMVSGFLGGLSGHQGALRSAFLLKCNLTKESFIATGVVIACLVDFSRITVYAGYLMKSHIGQYLNLLAAAVLSAFAGALIGNRLIPKVTMAAVQIIVSGLLILIAFLLGAGFI